jgi:hypothetical protein
MKKPNAWQLQVLILTGCMFGFFLLFGSHLVFSDNTSGRGMRDLVSLFGVSLLSALTALMGVSEWFYGSKTMAYADWSLAILVVLCKAYQVCNGI